jgi:mono/diheme cytochrome c family protein
LTLAVLCVDTALANPVPADDLSLLSGSDRFKQFCTECHGWDPEEQFTELYSDTVDTEEVEAVVGEILAAQNIGGSPTPEPEDFTEETEEDDWPDWAGPPPEDDVDEEEQLKADLLDDLTAVIEDVYDDDSEMYDWGEDDLGDPYESVDVWGDPGDDDIEEQVRVGGATDLTDPSSYVYGTDDIELFNNIAYGTGPTMPGFLSQLGSEEEVWNVVNYIRSLWGEDWLE